MDYFFCPHPLLLESGTVLPALTIAYSTFGQLNEDKSNVVWICHALTANSDATDWWKGVVGNGAVIDPEKYFIVCANILGSCYGTTGPLSNNPTTQKPYYSSFPTFTIRDMVNAHILLRQALGINKIFLLVGGSMGGYQALEWAVMEKNIIVNMCLLATSAKESAWGIATHTAQRLSIEADDTWQQHSASAGAKGLKAARAIGMLTYRNYDIMVKHQSDTDAEKTDNYKAAAYINYQGQKLANRFYSQSYWLLTKCMDSHHLARGRGGNLAEVLKSIQQKTLIIGITSDILCPVAEQFFLAKNIPHSSMVAIDSAFGHDGFMVEAALISQYLKEWMATI
jgi:homoserine O-acetyltransferase/O-succinyltransferase